MFLAALLFLLPLWGSAQLSPYATFYPQFAGAEELFQKEMYSAAREQLEEFKSTEAFVRLAPDNDLRAKALFMEAVCAYRLQRADAEGLLRAFTAEYSESTLFSDGSFFLGMYLFDQKNYRDAIKPFLDAYSSGSLASEYFFETVFKLGYSYFATDNGNQAVRFFDICAQRVNPYREDAQYYRSIIYYEMGNYAEAYQAFKDLESSPKYGKETKIYLAYTLYKLGRVDELNQMAEQISFSPRDQDMAAQVYYLVANAAYDRLQYARCADFFDRYVKARGKMSRLDHFRHGFSYYKTERPLDAIPSLEKAITSQSDSLTQAASYYLGFCFLKKPDLPSARFAFQKASVEGPKLNPSISKDALYQFAKVAFSSEAYTDAQRALTELSKKYPNEPFSAEVKELLGESFLYTRDYARSIEYFESQPLTSPRAKKAYQSVCYFYALEFFSRNEFNRAESYLRKSVAQNGDPEMTLNSAYWLAEVLFRQGKFTDAQRQYEAYQRMPGVQQHMYYAASFYGIGWCEFKAQRWTQAANLFDQFLKLNKNSTETRDMVVDATLRAGDANFVQGRYSQGDAYYSRVEGYRYTFQDYALFQLAESRYRQGNYSGSVQLFDRLINSFTQSDMRPKAIDRISEIYATWLDNSGRAVYYANLLVKDYPRDQLAAAAYNRLAIAAYVSGDEATAVQYFKKVLTDYDDEKAAEVALDNLGSLLSEAEYNRVFAAYRAKKPGGSPTMAKQTFNLGKDRFLAGQYDAAIGLFTDYINTNKNGEFYYEALFYRGRSNRNSNRLSAALEDFQAVYSTPSLNEFSNPATQEAAEIKFEQKDYNASLALYQNLDRTAGKALTRVSAKFGLAANYRALRQPDKAIIELRWIEQNNEVQLFSRTKATVEIGNNLYDQKNYEKALESFRSVIRDVKTELGAESQYMVIRILFDQKKYAEVIENGKSMNNDFPDYDEWRARAFLVVAEANYQTGEVFQAKGVLESITKDTRFPDIQAAAKKRLEEIEREEAANN
jgi:TolA-binding protein